MVVVVFQDVMLCSAGPGRLGLEWAECQPRPPSLPLFMRPSTKTPLQRIPASSGTLVALFHSRFIAHYYLLNLANFVSL